MSVYREATRKARKPHVCDACLRRIEAGSTYLHIVGHNTDGDFGASDFHPDCRAWEVHLCQINDLRSDEWMALHEHVENGGRGVLDGAPRAVAERFGVTFA